MKHKSVFYTLIALVVTQLFCGQVPSTQPTVSNSVIGQLWREQGDVEAGRESELIRIDSSHDMQPDDAVRVSNEGKARLDFGKGLEFTLYNETVSGGTRVDETNTSRQAAVKLSQGGLKGYNPPGSRTEVDVVNGVKIIILGTHYFVAYDSSTNQVWAYNVDGTMQYELPNGSTYILLRNNLVEITNGVVTNLYKDLAFTDADFDVFATRLQSPITAVQSLLDQLAPFTGTTFPKTGTPTVSPTASLMSTVTPTETPTSTPTSTSTPSPTSTPIPCYLAKFVTDVTIPDNTLIEPSTAFTKTWRLKNMGSCNWDAAYEVTFVGGEPMARVNVFKLTSGVVGYGQTVDVTVDLFSPEDSGTYQSDFKLRAPDGTLFGLGQKNDTFFVKIVVPQSNQLPGIPGIVSPVQNGYLYCDYYPTLTWTVPYDDSGVVEYEVMLEGTPNYCFTWCSVFGSSSTFVANNTLDISQYVGCYAKYRWMVRARDKDGALGGWTQWNYFDTTVYYVVK